MNEMNLGNAYGYSYVYKNSITSNVNQRKWP